MWPLRLRADRDPDPHRLLGRLAAMDLDEGACPDLDERAPGLAGLDLDRPLERRLLDLLEELAVLAEVDAEDLDPDVALALLALEAEPDGGLAAGVHAALDAAERDGAVGEFDDGRAGAGRRVLVDDRICRGHRDAVAAVLPDGEALVVRGDRDVEVGEDLAAAGDRDGRERRAVARLREAQPVVRVAAVRAPDARDGAG